MYIYTDGTEIYGWIDASLVLNDSSDSATTYNTWWQVVPVQNSSWQEGWLMMILCKTCLNKWVKKCTKWFCRMLEINSSCEFRECFYSRICHNIPSQIYPYMKRAKGCHGYLIFVLYWPFVQTLIKI